MEIVDKNEYFRKRPSNTRTSMEPINNPENKLAKNAKIATSGVSAMSPSLTGAVFRWVDRSLTICDPKKKAQMNPNGIIREIFLLTFGVKPIKAKI